jgi:hypothetical protein
LGATISLATSVHSGEGYYIKVLASGGPGPIGHYGLLVNFGSQSQSPISPPNTVVAQAPDQSGFTLNSVPADPTKGLPGLLQGLLTTIGDLTGWVFSYTIDGSLLSDLGLTLSAKPGASASLPPVEMASNTALPGGVLNSQGLVPASQSPSMTPAPQVVQVVAAPAPRPVQALDDAHGHSTSKNREPHPYGPLHKFRTMPGKENHRSRFGVRHSHT